MNGVNSRKPSVLLFIVIKCKKSRTDLKQYQESIYLIKKTAATQRID